MKVEPSTLKGLNVNILKVQPFQGCEFCFFHFHRFHRWLFKFYPFGITNQLIGVDSNIKLIRLPQLPMFSACRPLKSSAAF